MKNEHNLITILNYQQFPVFVKSPLLLLVSRRGAEGSQSKTQGLAGEPLFSNQLLFFR